MHDQVLTNQATSDYQMSWLEFDDEVEVIWADAKEKAHKTLGRYQGIAVPDQGGPCSFVLKDGDDEIDIDLERIAGMTTFGVSP